MLVIERKEGKKEDNCHHQEWIQKKEKTSKKTSSLLSLLSDSNQRPRDYKSRALAN